MTKLTNSEPLAEDLGKLLLRVVPGGIMLLDHGWPKLTGFGEMMETFPDPIGPGPAFRQRRSGEQTLSRQQLSSAK